MKQYLTRRHFLKHMSVAASLSMLPSFAIGNDSNKKPMNVLMIAIDDMNNWIGSLGGQAKTPNIDRLAQEGVLFSNSHCVVSACNPSRAALFTGLRPETTGQFNNNGNFRLRPGGEDIVTIPQHFRQNGYEAVAAGKMFHYPRGTADTPEPLSDPISWDRQFKGYGGTGGFDEYCDDDGYARWHHGKFKDPYVGKFCFWGPIKEKTEETGDWKTADFCADYLQQQHDKPFFLGCGIVRPHSPQLAPQKYFDMYDKDSLELPEIPEDDMEDIPEIARVGFYTDFVKNGVLAMGELRNAVHGYLASMSFADACVGHVLDTLEKSPYADNTIVVLWTDHGWHLGDKYRWEKFSTWNQATQAPLIFKVPNLTKPNQVSGRAVSFLDIYPTLIDLCNLPARQELEGRSIVPLLKNPNHQGQYVAVNTDHWSPYYSVKMDHWNYIRYSDGSEELYDHRTDPHEFKNLANLPVYAELKKKLQTYIPTPKSHPKWRTHKTERQRNKHI